MTAALIVGGDQIDGIKQVLASHGINRVTHWSGRKVGDGKKVIPNDTELVVLVTNWISHNFTHKVKQAASKRGLKIVYTPNGPAALNARLKLIGTDVAKEADCRLTFANNNSALSNSLLTNFIRRWLSI